MIQFAKAVYSENSLKFSIFVKMLHNIFRHNTDYVIYSGVCFAACLPATVLHDLLIGVLAEFMALEKVYDVCMVFCANCNIHEDDT